MEEGRTCENNNHCQMDIILYVFQVTELVSGINAAPKWKL